jgi:hypothetical protein
MELTVPAPGLQPGDIVVIGNLASQKVAGVRKSIEKLVVITTWS